MSNIKACPYGTSFEGRQMSNQVQSQNDNTKLMSNIQIPMTNKYPNPKSKRYDLAERTAKFGEAVILFARGLPKNDIIRPLINQIVRSGASVGVNHMEADGAESKKDFQHKVALCRKELKETKHWLRMIVCADTGSQLSCRKLWDEAQQLTFIFSSILSKSK